jgi:1,4-alpha-glucan branching enzyme
MLGKMPGDAWQKFANMRLLLAYQLTCPGKKLNFMGNEFAQGPEWSAARELHWAQRGEGWHAGVARAFRDLSRLYRECPALHDLDFSPDGFAWLDCDDGERSLLAYLRRARDGSFVCVALNFTPVPRPAYTLGVPAAGSYRELINTDSRHYGGGDAGNAGEVLARPIPAQGQPASLSIVLPPLGAVVFAPVRG